MRQFAEEHSRDVGARRCLRCAANQLYDLEIIGYLAKTESEYHLNDRNQTPMLDLQLPLGLAIRPATPADNAFIEKLYKSTREDLQLVDAEQDFIETLIEQQFNAQRIGYGTQFPNAMYFIIEKHGHAIGRATLDFGSVEIRVVDIAFIAEARGKGFGEGVLKALQYAAGKTCTPLSLSVHTGNRAAKSLYAKLGFQVEQVSPPYEHLIWRPTLREINA